MEWIIVGGIVLFILLVIILIIALINQVNELRQINIPRKQVKRQYILEVTEVGEIKLREKDPGGGYKYRQF